MFHCMLLRKPTFDALLLKMSSQIKEITMDNAKLLLQIDNANLTDNDFKNKYRSERLAL